MREDQLIEFVADGKIMEYFELMRTLSELEGDGFIKITPSAFASGSLVGISELGKTTLDIFKKELSLTWREETEEYFDKNRDRLVMESKLSADYLRIGENQYRLTMRIIEKSLPVFEVMMICSSKEEADKFANGWKRNAAQVYLETTNAIIKK